MRNLNHYTQKKIAEQFGDFIFFTGFAIVVMVIVCKIWGIEVVTLLGISIIIGLELSRYDFSR